MIERPSWDEIFIEECELHSKRSTCLSRKVGAVAVKDNRVLATGYNGAPPGVEHCKECLRRKLGIPSGERHEICRGLHAEQNLIIQAAYFGASLKNSTIYCNTAPCNICMKMLVSIKPERIVYKSHYSDNYADDVARKSGFVLIINEKTGFYEYTKNTD